VVFWTVKIVSKLSINAVCKKNQPMKRGRKKYSHDQSNQWTFAVTHCGARREKNLNSIVLNIVWEMRLPMLIAMCVRTIWGGLQLNLFLTLFFESKFSSVTRQVRCATGIEFHDRACDIALFRGIPLDDEQIL
jgi:hypothetical protein